MNPAPQTPSSTSQPWDPAIAPAHRAAMCSPNPLPKEWEDFYLLVTGNKENSPIGHVSDRHHAWEMQHTALVWEWPAWFPSQTRNELLSQAKGVQKQQVTGSKSLLSGDPPQSFFSQKSLLPATAEFEEEKLSKPKELAH